MRQLSRRRLVHAGAAASAGYFFRGGTVLSANPLGLPVGCQTWPVRLAIARDFPGTLRHLAAAGYETIEMCSPFVYREGFGDLVNVKPEDLRQTIKNAGLSCDSCHFGLRELRENLETRIGWAKGLGLKQMVISSFGLPRAPTAGDWEKAAGDANRIGEQVLKAGMQTGYHNHDIEFSELDGALIFDKLMSFFDPKFVKMQFQVLVIRLGYKAAKFMNRYPGRFISLHLQDWSPAENKQVPIGQGTIDWKELFTAAKKAGVRNYYVEMNMDALEASSPYLRDLKV
jgi:sugar phosphate isomerase/epimerase